MIKRLLLSLKYRKEIEKLNSEIKAFEELKESNAYLKNNIIKNHKIRIKHLKSKIDDIEKAKLINFDLIKPYIYKFNKFFWLPLLISLFIGIFYLKPAIIGYVTELNSVKYSLDVNQTFSNSGTYSFNIDKKGLLTSLKISGDIIGQGNIKIYIEKDGVKYIVLDSNILKEKGVPSITAFAVKEDKEKDKEGKDKDDKTKEKEKNESLEIPINETINITIPLNATINETAINETINETTLTNQTLNITPIINETISIINKSIAINLKYKEDSTYDEDNDGIEDINKAIDLSVENTKFNWNVDEAKICTRWEVYNIDEDKATTLCYGSNECCNLINLQSSRESWNGAFYSVYGQDGVGLSNIISSQVIYANYSLDVDAPYADIVYSEWSNLSTAYNYERIVFKGVCKDTCSLENFNESSYTLIIEIENSTLHLDEIIYFLHPKIVKYVFNVQVQGEEKNIPTLIEVYKDKSLIDVFVGDFELESGVYDINLILQNSSIEKIILEDFELNSDVDKKILIGDIKSNISIEYLDIKKKHAIETHTGSIILTSTAFGNVLFICKKWDKDLESCFGQWEKERDLKVGEPYNLSISGKLLAFVEGSLNEASGLNFIKEIPNISMDKNDVSKIDLTEHFLNIDNSTIFSYYENSNLLISFINSTTTVAAKDFTGTFYTYITANKSNSLSISNVFSVYIQNTTMAFVYNLSDPLVQEKLRNYTDLQLKPILKYNSINFTNYEINNDVVIMNITIDDKTIRWLASLSTFNEVLSG